MADGLSATLKRLARAAEDRDQPRLASFARGLAIGALVGAAIAGSTLWQRRRLAGRPAEEPDGTEAATELAADEAEAGADQAGAAPGPPVAAAPVAPSDTDGRRLG
jgi:hypothetical protein